MSSTKHIFIVNSFCTHIAEKEEVYEIQHRSNKYFMFTISENIIILCLLEPMKFLLILLKNDVLRLSIYFAGLFLKKS